MPVSKNRRKKVKKRIMKPRTFQTFKSARRFLSRFKWKIITGKGTFSKQMNKTITFAYNATNNSIQGKR